MENHKCKLCLKSFSNGRALGGHMRSHVMNLPLKPDEEHEEEQEDDDEKDEEEAVNELSEETESVSSYSSDEDEEEDDDEDKCRLYGLEEDPKTDYRSVVDHEALFHVHEGDHSIVLQDRESETESSRNMTRRRSKRIRRKVRLDESSSWVETEPVSSVSDTTTEEDIAFCLMMLSRDKWNNNEEDEDEEYDEDGDEERKHKLKHKLKRNRIDEVEEEEETDELEEFIKLCPKNRGKLYRCETCERAFKSYQALGGHRASHKKMKSNQVSSQRKIEREQENVVTVGPTAITTVAASVVEKKLHECPLCFRIFSSGQALGGHKRSHGSQLLETTSSVVGESSIKVRDGLIDLNLPAPIDDDEFSQIELSAVSYSEYMNHYSTR